MLSPLELGLAYKNQTGNSGRWLAYKVGLRNPRTGQFSLQMWQQLFWTNNKGQTPVKLKGVKAYAFKEKVVSTSMRSVNPDDIVLLENVKYEEIDSINGSDQGTIPMKRLRIYGDGIQCAGFDRKPHRGPPWSLIFLGAAAGRRMKIVFFRGELRGAIPW